MSYMLIRSQDRTHCARIHHYWVDDCGTIYGRSWSSTSIRLGDYNTKELGLLVMDEMYNEHRLYGSDWYNMPSASSAYAKHASKLPEDVV